MDVVPADILVIGAGGAGLRAAISIAETSSSLAVSLLSKVYPMRSHTVAAEGGAAGVTKDNDSLDDHFITRLLAETGYPIRMPLSFSLRLRPLNSLK